MIDRNNDRPPLALQRQLTASYHTLSIRFRVVHISRLPPPAVEGKQQTSAQFADPTIFADLLTPLKYCISATLDQAISAQREEVAKLMSLRHVRGWNSVGVFGKLECLANTYESVGLYEEALRCFQELEDVYRECLDEGELTFFPSLTPTSLSEGEDSSSILSTSGKPYRDMILHNSASLWELKRYLLARRLMLLSKLGRGLAVMRETLTWLAEMKNMVKDEDLPPHSLSALTLAVCLDIVHHCQHLFLSPSGVLEASLPTPSFAQTLHADGGVLNRLPPMFHAASGEMLSVCLQEMNKMGTSFEYLPPLEPFIAARAARHLEKTRETSGITRPELLAAIEGEENFCSFYQTLAQRTLDALKRSGRSRSQWTIQTSLATLELHRGNVESAHQTFSSLLDFQAEQSSRWPPLERLLLRRQLECHTRLGKPKNRAWVASVVSLLRSMPSQQEDVPLQEDFERDQDDWGDAGKLFDRLRSASMDFEKEVPVSGFAKLSIVAGTTSARLLGDQDGIELPVSVFSSLTSAFRADDVRFCLTGGNARREQLWLTSGPSVIKPGRNDILLRSYANAPGAYVLDVHQIRLGRIVFQSIANKTVPGAGSSQSNALMPTLIRVPFDGEALHGKLQQPQLIALDQPRLSELVLRSGRNSVESATIRLLHEVDQRPLMGFGAAELEEGSYAELEATEDGLGVKVSQLQDETRLRFPLDEAPPADGSAMPLILEVEYSTPAIGQVPARPKRLLRQRLELATALPLGVNVQDFFRLETLLCKFSISTGAGSTLRVKSAMLDHENASSQGADSLYKVEGPEQQQGRSTVVTARQPAAYVFRIQHRPRSKASRSASIGAGALRLSIVYRTLHEDAGSLVTRELKDQLSELPARVEGQLGIGLPNLLLDAFEDMTNEHLDVPLYALTGSIRFRAGSDTRTWRRRIHQDWGIERTEARAGIVLGVVQKVISNLARCTPASLVKAGVEGSEDAWRVLEIPIEVPQMDLVNQVQLKLAQSDNPSSRYLVVGKPVPVQVQIQSTASWSASMLPIESGGGADVQSTSLGDTLAPSTRPSTKSSAASSTGGDHDTDAGSVFEDAISKSGSDHTEVGPAAANGEATDGDALPTVESARRNQKTQRLTYEIQSDFENWIVSGAKRGVWEVPTDSSAPHSQTFDVMLIPLRAGSLTLPTIVVWPLPSAPSALPPSVAHGGGTAAARAAAERDNLPSCESYVANAAERVRVLDVGLVSGRSRRLGQADSGEEIYEGEDDDEAATATSTPTTFWLQHQPQAA